MSVFINLINEVIDMGATIMLPAVVIILSICMRIRLGKVIKSGLLIGASFVGINLIVNMMNEELGPAARAMSGRFGLSLSVIDVGWQGAAPVAWAWGISAAGVLIAVGINLLMLMTRMTRTVNIDIWNIWHMVFTGAIAWNATGNVWIGLAGIAVHAALTYKLGDFWAPFIAEYFELDGLTVPNGSAAYMAPVACLVDAVIERIPGVNKIDFSLEDLQDRAGFLAEPVVMGGILGCMIGLLAGYPVDEVLPLGIEMSAVMMLMPKIVKCIMEGLLPLAERAKELLSKRFGSSEAYIGLDPAILLGNSQVVTAGLIFIPLTLLIALLVPGNRVLPFGDLATISYFIAISVAIHKGNLFRTLISGSAIMYLTIWITNQTVPWFTSLAKTVGMLGKSHEIAAMDQGGSPVTYIFTEIFVRDNLSGFAVVLIIYGVCLWASFRYSAKARQRMEQDNQASRGY